MLHFSAQSSGLLCEENDGQSGPTVKYVGYCQFHWNKKVLVLSSLIDYLALIIQAGGLYWENLEQGH